MDTQFILAIDQGTSSTKSIIIDNRGRVCATASEPLETLYLNDGFVEQDAAGIYQNVLASIKKCVADFESKGGKRAQITACGISNQRETFLLWDKSGDPLCKAIVWQCKRSIEICQRLRSRDLEGTIKSKTGLLIDPYFSGTKLIWVYENLPSVRRDIDAGKAYFGTIDTWLLYKLTNGARYCTDYTNASRTLFFNLARLAWDQELLKTFGLSNVNLPECQPSSSLFGSTDLDGLLKKPINITAMVGDSHAAAFGEGCHQPGTAKATLGTGCSVIMNVGSGVRSSKQGMVSTICWSTEDNVQFALEGVIVTCGATIEWLRKELGLITDSKHTELMAESVDDTGGVYLIPAFSGLGAPHWDMSRRASITGLTFSSNKNHIVRAALESIAFQIKDVIVAMEEDTGIRLSHLMVDGGISANKFVVQFLADVLGRDVVNIGVQDVSAVGAAYLAGLKAGIFENIEMLSGLHTKKDVYRPNDTGKAERAYEGWRKALARN